MDVRLETTKFFWDLTLAEINEAKPWTRHSLEQICSVPDPDLSLLVVGESGELLPTLISLSRDNAIAYVLKSFLFCECEYYLWMM